ncbi:MAG: sulfite exporter TauE/SafE family protein [bacterium]|nr:sulfite exporter TauE/SafE family protein [bacterium]MCP5070332.1 sulfite exporter TauE/SafE family protein [bacterium]
MEGGELLLLWAVAFATAVLSAVVGMAGGITLLGVMLLFLPPLVAIPLHGTIQLVSNGSRTWIQRSHVDRGILLRFGLLLLPMGVLGIAVAQELPEALVRAGIGVFVLTATWAPGILLLGTHPEAIDRGRRFLGLGAAAGFLNMTIGATGPLLAPFFLNLGLDRRQLVGTKAGCQMLGHLAKILLFGLSGFAFEEHLPLMVGATIGVVAGTWLGSRLLEKVSERLFRVLYRSVLTLIALRLIIVELLALA